jgi:adenylate kinase family enzyme
VSSRLVILTGASGSGKTTLARHFRERSGGDCEVFFFDSIGVPKLETMHADYAGPEAWQRAMTLQWVASIGAVLSAGRPVLFEGQMRIAFIREALSAQQIENARVILVDCDDATRAARLHITRSQLGLANPAMMNWARYLA